MKLIVAYIRPERLNEVKRNLYAKEIHNISVTNSLGSGRQGGFHESYRGVDIEVNLNKKMRLEIGVNEEFLDMAIKAITDGARTGNLGDGVIFVTNLEQCVRIRTGEIGHDAIG